MKALTHWIYIILLVVGITTAQTSKAQSFIPIPESYTTVPNGYQALSSVNLNDTTSWFKWTQDSTQLSISIKMLTSSGKYRVKLARLYVQKAGGQIGIINEEPIRTADSTIYFYARGLNPGTDLYLKIVTEEFCPGCSSAPSTARLVFAPEADNCQFTPLSCDLVTDGQMEGFTDCGSMHTTSEAHPYNDWQACHWVLPNSINGIVGTADYFNACAPAGMSNSTNWVNTWSTCQSISPHSLDGYSGISVYEAAPAEPERREYIVNRLNAPMLANKTYSISLWVRLANVSKYATNKISMLLTNNIPIQNSNGNIPTIIPTSPGEYIPTFNGNAFITDKTSWTHLSLVYTPATTNSFVTLGNFSAAAQTPTIDLDPSDSWSYGAVGINCSNHGHYSYYYVDDVNIRPIDIDAGPNTSICPSQSVTLTSSLICPPTGGTVSYSWTPGASLSTPTASSTVASPSTTTNYTVTATITFTDGTAPIVIRDTVKVSVINVTFTLTASASPSIICAGSSSTLNTNGGSNLPYVWTDGVNTYTASNPVVSPTVTTTYTVSTIYCSRTLTASVTVTVNPAPTFTLSSSLACEGSTVAVSTSSSTTITYIDFGDPLSTTNVINPHAYNSAGNYTITIGAYNSAGSCSTNTVIPVTVVSSQSMSLTYTSTPCSYDYTFTANFGCSNNAYDNVLSIDPLGINMGPQTNNDFPFTFPAPGTYTITLLSSFNNYGEVVEAIITIPAVVTPTVTASASPSVICTGQITTLNATGASTYTWQPGGATGSLASFSPTTTTVYTVTGTNTQGCTNTKTLSVTVNSLPSVGVTASPTAICAGSTTTLTASGATSWSWNTGPTTASISVTPSVTTTYTVIGTNASGCSATKTIQIEVNSNPAISAVPSTSTICPGGSATLTASGGTSYTWAPVVSNNTVVVVSPTVTTTYTLSSNVPGCGIKTSTIQITVSPLSVNATATPTSACIGSSFTLTASGANTYTWSPGALTGSVVVVTPTLTTTNYTVTGNNGYGCTGTKTLSIVAYSYPTIGLTPVTGTICAVTSYTIKALTSGLSYTWQPGVLTTSVIVVTPSVTTVYTVTGKNNTTGCASTRTAVVVVNPFSAVSANPSTICIGQTATLSAQGASSYTWSTGPNTSSITVSPTVTTVYTVTGTGSGCTSSLTLTLTVNPNPTVTASASPTAICSGQSTTLTAGGATTYSWNPGGSTANPFIASPGSTTVYTVTGTSAGCSRTKTVSVNVSPTPTISLPSQTVICTGYSVTLTASGATSYSWSTGAVTNTILVSSPTATTQNYTVTGTTGSCSGSKTIKVIIIPPPNITAVASPSTICAGGTSTLTGYSGLVGSYTWTPGPVNNNPITVMPTANTVYTVTARNAGCSGSNTVQVNIQTPTVVATPNPATICLGNSSILSGSGASTYTWNTGPTTSSISVSPTVTTTYSVTGTTSIGCVGTGTAMVAVTTGTFPAFSIITSSTSPVIDNGTGTNVVNLSSTISNTTGLNFEWMPNGATTPTAALNLTQPEIISLTVRDPVCNTSSTQSVCMNYVSQSCANTYSTLNNATLTNTASLADGTYFVTGTLTINWTTPANALEDKTFIMATGSKVEITATSDVYFNNMKFYSCDGMWQGIELKTSGSGGAVLTISGDNNSIEDAYRGVYSINPGGTNRNATLQIINDVLFNKNYCDVYLENTANPTGTFPFTSSESRMLSEASNNSPGGNLKCSGYYSPPVKARSYAGVYAKNAGVIDFNTPQSNVADYNLIKNKDYGLYFDNTSANVNNVDFNSAIGAAYVYSLNLTPFVTGVGIYSQNSGYLKVGPATTPTTGVTTNFTDMGYGVITNNTYTVDVQNTTFTNTAQSVTIDPIWGVKPEWWGQVHYAGYGLNGVFITNASDVLRVNNNEFNSNYYPVTANYTVAPNSGHIMSVAQNTISTTAVGQVHVKEGVTVNSAISFTPTANNMRVAVNTFSNVTIGVKVNSTVSGLRISNNTILTTTLQANQRGVYLINSSDVTVDNNSISSAYTGTNAGNYSPTNAGIFSEASPGCKIKCNTITQTGIGVQYMGGNSSPGDGLFGNTFTYPMRRGLWLSKGGLMGVQGNSLSASANVWSGFSNVTGVDQTYVGGAFTGTNPPSNGPSSPLWVRNTSTELPTDNEFGNPSVITNKYDFSAFTLSSSAPSYTPGCPATLTVGLRMAANSNDIDNTDRDNDFVNYINNILPSSNTGFTPQDKFMLKQYMFDALSTEPSANTELLDFYQHQQNTAIEDYHVIDSLLASGNLNVAAAQNAAAPVDNDIIQTQNAYNALYLNGINSTTDLQSLEALADLCPSQYGTAVYQARALLQTITYMYKQYNDSCGTDKINSRFDNEENKQNVSVSGGVQAKLFPNPNTGAFTLAYDLKANPKAKVRITDIAGKMVYSSIVDNLNNRKEINTEHLQGGIYFIQLLDDVKLLWTDKLIITK
jgi:hypothetical protein